MKAFYIGFLLIFSCFFSLAQSGTDIKFQIDNYDQDSLLIGYYYGQRQLVLDTLLSSEEGTFRMKHDTLLPGGVYLCIFKPTNTYLEFMLNRIEPQQFEVYINMDSLSRPVFSGSKDNIAFYEYLQYLQSQRDKMTVLGTLKDSLSNQLQATDDIEKEIEKLNEEVLSFQNKFVSDHPEYVSSKLIKSNFNFDIPEFEGDENTVKLRRFHYYRDHYFDFIDLADPDMLRTPVLEQRIMNYKDKLTVQSPDSISKSIDYILKKLEPSKESYRYFLSSFINEYAKSKIVGFDAVYVHLALNYYGKGKAPWIDGENLSEIIENAKKLEPILIGKKAPDITVYKEDGSPVTLSEIESKFTVLLFWASDCGHCKKSMPEIISFYNKYKDQGVTMLAVCTKHREKAKDCWEFIKQREGMEQFINCNDEFHKSGFRNKYNVESTPQIFILDKDKNIVVKRIGSEQLDEVLQELIMLEDQKIMDSMER